MAVGRAREGAAALGQHHGAALRAQLAHEVAREAAAVSEHEQAAAGIGRRHDDQRLRALPRGHIERVSVGSLRRLRSAGRFDPVAAALERVRRQRHAPTRGARAAGGPVDVHARHPQLGQRLRDLLRIACLLLRMRLAGEHAGGGVGQRMLARQARQRFAGTDFEQHAARHLQQGAHAVGVLHGAAQVARPVGGAHGLFGRDELARDVRDKGNRRRPARHRSDERFERREQRLGHRRVRSDRHMQPARQVPRRAQPRLGGLDRFARAGDHAQLFSVGGGEVAARRQEGRERGLRQRHGGHRTGRHRLQQATAQGRDTQRVFEAEHARQAGGDVLAQAVAHHRGGPHAAAHPPLRHRVRDDEERGLRECDVEQPRVGLGFAAGRGEQHGAQVETQLGFQQRAAAVDVVAEGRVVLVERAAHLGVLRAATGKRKSTSGACAGAARTARPSPAESSCTAPSAWSATTALRCSKARRPACRVWAMSVSGSAGCARR